MNICMMQSLVTPRYVFVACSMALYSWKTASQFNHIIWFPSYKSTTSIATVQRVKSALNVITTTWIVIHIETILNFSRGILIVIWVGIVSRYLTYDLFPVKTCPSALLM
jgi:hypothetical protein